MIWIDLIGRLGRSLNGCDRSELAGHLDHWMGVIQVDLIGLFDVSGVLDRGVDAI